jgi:hypothetical protein
MGLSRLYGSIPKRNAWVEVIKILPTQLLIFPVYPFVVPVFSETKKMRFLG